jgi:hypothetical protein
LNNHRNKIQPTTTINASVEFTKIVIARLPDYGTTSAAVVAEQMLHTLKEIRCGLMFGIGFGVSSLEHDIRLGDIVISRPEATFGGVVQYDFGKTLKDGENGGTRSLDRPPRTLLTALRTLESTHDTKLTIFLSEIRTKYPKMKPSTSLQVQKPVGDSERTTIIRTPRKTVILASRPN